MIRIVPLELEAAQRMVTAHHKRPTEAIQAVCSMVMELGRWSIADQKRKARRAA